MPGRDNAGKEKCWIEEELGGKMLGRANIGEKKYLGMRKVDEEKCRGGKCWEVNNSLGFTIDTILLFC